MRRITLLTVLLLISAAVFAASSIDGKWNMDVRDQGGEVIRQLKLDIAIAEGKATGKLGSSEIAGTYSETEGLQLEFPFLDDDSGSKATLVIKGKLDGEKLKGEWKWGPSSSGQFEASRLN